MMVFRKLQVCLNFYWKLFEWITARYEKTIANWLECDHMALNSKTFSEAKTSFFIMSRYLRVLSEKI